MDMICWICLSENEEKNSNQWTSPCLCIGTNQWVHQSCILRWIDEKQNGDIEKKVVCPQCLFEYKINQPRPSLIISCLCLIDYQINAYCPYFLLTIISGSIYLFSLFYGIVAVCQFVGIHDGITLIRKLDPFTFYLTLPMIPYMLVFPRMLSPELMALIDLEDANLEDTNSRNNLSIENDTLFQTEKVLSPRDIIGGLCLPSIAYLFGKLFDSRIGNFQRSLLGGITYLITKNFLRVWFWKQKKYLLDQRKIVSLSRFQKS